jgi:hypothetical protein
MQQLRRRGGIDLPGYTQAAVLNLVLKQSRNSRLIFRPCKCVQLWAFYAKKFAKSIGFRLGEFHSEHTKNM